MEFNPAEKDVISCNTANLSTDTNNLDNSTEDTFFLPESEGNCGIDSIETRFETLIETKKELRTEWYKNLGIDRSYASKIKRGLIIPNEEWRIKLAGYFGVDSSVIWKPKDILLIDKMAEELK